jgi:predicted  nucleic acid-binding Zn-ribbon protein
MSKSVNVQQKKDPTDVVHWNVYEALCNHLTHLIDVANIQQNLCVVDFEIKEAKEAVAKTQETMTAIQRSITDLTQAVTTLQASVDRQCNQ